MSASQKQVKTIRTVDRRCRHRWVRSEDHLDLLEAIPLNRPRSASDQTADRNQSIEAIVDGSAAGAAERSQLGKRQRLIDAGQRGDDALVDRSSARGLGDMGRSTTLMTTA